MVENVDGKATAYPVTENFEFQTDRKVPKLGVMFVGWGGNNGSTVTGGIIANKHKLSWETKTKTMTANYWGSMTQASTTWVGTDAQGREVFAPINKVGIDQLLGLLLALLVQRKVSFISYRHWAIFSTILCVSGSSYGKSK